MFWASESHGWVERGGSWISPTVSLETCGLMGLGSEVGPVRAVNGYG